MMKIILVALSLFFAVPALAETYSWVDDNGTVNFSENLGSVPKKYRKKVRIIGADQTGVEIKDMDEPAKGKVKGDEKKAEPKDGKESKKKQTYGGRDEASWKNEFKRLKADIRAAEEQLEQTRTRLADSSQMSRSEYLTLQHTAKNTEFRLADLRKKLDALNDSANKAEVPQEFRGD